MSEVESRNIRDYVQSLEPIPILSECLHSYSQLILWPYGYAHNAYPENYEEIRDLAIEAAEALKAVHGTVFDPINSADLCKCLKSISLKKIARQAYRLGKFFFLSMFPIFVYAIL